MFLWREVFLTVWKVVKRVGLIICTIYLFFSFNTLYSIQMLTRLSIPIIVLFIVYQILILLVGFSFLRMSISKNCTTLELFPETDETEDSDDSSLHLNPFEKEHIFAYKHEMNICEICNTSQPMRSYHCSACNRCLLLMFKHLTWCDLCVGFTNYKFYIVFLFYLVILSGLGLGCFIDAIINNSLVDYSNAPLYVSIVLQALGLVFVLYYFVEGVYSVCINQTPQERKHPMENTNISYDMGYYQNWKMIMGESWYTWFMPSWTTEGDGLKFQHTRKTGPEVYESTALTVSTE
ncbi:palmitoyltransferase ZDHHC2/15/20 [Nematocida minor]|uniref:palmitoyltransferase ZDHHC2/15/20 n=1 Tax=Nematocida minor TaxID=1912983 RepID=UPI002220EABA|nr:palmitoyltransferase ZDHHC2/15/20 [Nematocida minor]KAI5192358.1 palmitoyltransferase ZDHHC2/15/20 [Nematocida minor]